MRFNPLRLNRRRFLKTAAAGVAGGTLYWATRDVVRLGVIGCGVRGQYLAMSILQTLPERLAAEVVALCDVHQPSVDHVRRRYAPLASMHENYRELLARDDIAGVIIATPDHWHVPMALEAIRAGKAIYCEKPLSLTVREGQVLRDAVERSKTVFQVGTQQRSQERFQTACELVRNGRLGDIQKITVTLPPSRVGGPFPVEAVPPELNWDLWLGPSPEIAYCPERRRYFRGWYDYSGGTLADWGAHQLDIVHWALDCEDRGPITVAGHAELPATPGGYNTPGTYTVDYKYPGGVAVHVQTAMKDQGILFEGSRGRIFVNRDRLTGKPVEELKQRPLESSSLRVRKTQELWGSGVVRHLRDFYRSVRSGEPTTSGVAVQHRSATACHIANISLRLGRKLTWDAAIERFVNDSEADSYLARVSRAGYGGDALIPAVPSGGAAGLEHGPLAN